METTCEEERHILNLMKKGSMEIGSEKDQYIKERLAELKFERIYYSPPIVLQSQESVVVTTSYGYSPHYSLEWINSRPWPVFISKEENNFGVASEPWDNVGQEIASCMRFILMFWDYLPKNELSYRVKKRPGIKKDIKCPTSLETFVYTILNL